MPEFAVTGRGSAASRFQLLACGANCRFRPSSRRPAPGPSLGFTGVLEKTQTKQIYKSAGSAGATSDRLPPAYPATRRCKLRNTVAALLL